MGAYPRSERIIKSFRELQRGKIDKDELKRRVREESRRVVQLQLETGLRYVVDGMLEWHDLLRPMAETLQGVEVDGLARWFDNNTFYRKPIIREAVSRGRPILSDYIYPDLVPAGRWKLVLPDPYTFVSLSDNLSGIRMEELMFEYAEALNVELVELQAKHVVGQVQLSSPSLVWGRLDRDLLHSVGETISVMLKGIKSEKMIHFYFGDGLKVLPHALEYDVDVLGFDLTSTNMKELAEYDVEKIGLGIVDGRNSLIENPRTVAEKISRYIDKRDPGLLYVTPSCELEFLPPEVAEEKVRLLASIVKIVGEEA